VAFEVEVQLEGHGAVHLIHEDAEVEVPFEAGEEPDEERDVAEVGFDDAIDAPVLHLHCDLVAVAGAGTVDLREGGGGDGGTFEVVEDRVGVGAELGGDLLDYLGEGAGRHTILEPAEDGDVLRGRYIGTAGDELATLDEEAFHLCRQAVHALRVLAVGSSVAPVALFPGQLLVALDALVGEVDDEEVPAHEEESLGTAMKRERCGAGESLGHCSTIVAGGEAAEEGGPGNTPFPSVRGRRFRRAPGSPE
jgi:hypothetical protein